MNAQEEAYLVGEFLLQQIGDVKKDTDWKDLVRNLFQTASFKGFDTYGELRFGLPTRVGPYLVRNEHGNVLGPNITDDFVANNPVHDGLCVFLTSVCQETKKRYLLINSFTLRKSRRRYCVVCNLSLLLEIRTSSGYNFFVWNSTTKMQAELMNATMHATCIGSFDRFVMLKSETAKTHLLDTLARNRGRREKYWNHAMRDKNRMYVPVRDVDSSVLLIDDHGSMFYE